MLTFEINGVKIEIEAVNPVVRIVTPEVPVPDPVKVFVPFVLNNQERALITAGQRILAIKSVRDRTGAGIKESKDLVEALSPTPSFLDEPVRSAPRLSDPVRSVPSLSDAIDAAARDEA